MDDRELDYRLKQIEEKLDWIIKIYEEEEKEENEERIQTRPKV